QDRPGRPRRQRRPARRPGRDAHTTTRRERVGVGERPNRGGQGEAHRQEAGRDRAARRRAVRLTAALSSLKPSVLRGPLALAALYVVPLVLWATSAPLRPRFTGQYTTLTSIAVLLAFAGTSAFAMNLVLGARLRPVESFFGGLDRMYRVHRLNGQL